jgi:nucleoside-diphosphate kinase
MVVSPVDWMRDRISWPSVAPGSGKVHARVALKQGGNAPSCVKTHTERVHRPGVAGSSNLAAWRSGGYNAAASRSSCANVDISQKGSSTMAIERTFSIIKPDAAARNLTGAVNAMIEQAGLRIIAQKRVRISREQAETFYAVHKARPFFGELVDFMISGPVVVQVLEGDNAIAKYRDIMGATDPAKAAANTIRKVHAKSIGENSVHGSDAPDTAAKEIAQFFSGNEIVG